MNKNKGNNPIIKKTTFFDFLIALGNGLVNLMKIENIICIAILYLLGRDLFFILNIEQGEIYQKNILDATHILQMILENENNKDVIYLSIILVLCAIIAVLIGVIKFVYKKEIQRLAKERSRLMHDFRNGNFIPLREHNSSEWEENL